MTSCGPARLRRRSAPRYSQRIVRCSAPRTSVPLPRPATVWTSLSCSGVWSTGVGSHCCSVTRTPPPSTGSRGCNRGRSASPRRPPTHPYDLGRGQRKINRAECRLWPAGGRPQPVDRDAKVCGFGSCRSWVSFLGLGSRQTPSSRSPTTGWAGRPRTRLRPARTCRPRRGPRRQAPGLQPRRRRNGRHRGAAVPVAGHRLTLRSRPA